MIGKGCAAARVQQGPVLCKGLRLLRATIKVQFGRVLKGFHLGRRKVEIMGEVKEADNALICDVLRGDFHFPSPS